MKQLPLKPHTDWSRETRKELALLKAGSDPHQTKITSFYQVAENVTKLTHEIRVSQDSLSC